MSNTEALQLADALPENAGTLLLYREQAADHIRRLVAEVEALKADAERYRWLRENAKWWSWHPDTRCYPGKTVGFAYCGTGYLDYDFEAAINAARSRA